jgi:hypothetical protein
MDHDAMAPVAEMRRQAAEGFGRDGLELDQRRRLQRPPGEGVGKRVVAHGRRTNFVEQIVAIMVRMDETLTWRRC